jgi:hypothetical protein
MSNRPEVEGALSLATYHERLAGYRHWSGRWYAATTPQATRHRAKSQKLQRRAALLARRGASGSCLVED